MGAKGRGWRGEKTGRWREGPEQAREVEKAEGRGAEWVDGVQEG
jgi:hypothetical protein